MSDRQITSAYSMVDVMAAFTRINDRRPEFARLVNEITLEQLKSSPEVEEKDPWKHVAQHFLDILPAVMSDPRVEEMMPGIASEYGQLPSNSETRLNDDPGNESGGLGSLGIAALLGVQIASFSIIDYCLGPATVPKGTSVEVHHLWPFC